MDCRSQYSSQPAVFEYLRTKFNNITPSWIKELISKFPTATIECLIARCEQYSNPHSCNQRHHRQSNRHSANCQHGEHKQGCEHDHEHETFTFKEFGDRLVACNGDCGSKLSEIIHMVCKKQVM